MIQPPGTAFTAQQIQELNQKLAEFRHNVNNHLALIVASVELLRRRPELMGRVTEALIETPQKITEEMRKFSHDFEKAFGIAPTAASLNRSSVTEPVPHDTPI
jgi:hypothetical protein